MNDNRNTSWQQGNGNTRDYTYSRDNLGGGRGSSQGTPDGNGRYAPGAYGGAQPSGRTGTGYRPAGYQPVRTGQTGRYVQSGQTGQSGQYRPASQRQAQYPGRDMQNTYNARNGNRPSQPRTPGQSPQTRKPDRRYIPFFSVLLAIMVLVGIIFTAVKAKDRRAAAAGGAADTVGNVSDIQENNGISGAENNDFAGGTPSPAYAVRTSKTVTLGSEIASDCAIMIDLSTNTIVAEKNPDIQIYPASMTKIMTLIVAYENCKNFDDLFTMTAEITDAAYSEGASVAGFAAGEQVSVRDLLYGAILPSGADATEALAIYTSGTAEKFVELMNRKALQMGLSNTHFSNASGLHDKDHYSTPHEIALILEYALGIEECRKILSTYQYTTAPTPEHPDGILLTSTMFSRMRGDESGVAEVIAGKTGYTNEGLHCLASMAKTSDGKEYVLVTAHAPATYDPIYDCINIYKKLFGNE